LAFRSLRLILPALGLIGYSLLVASPRCVGMSGSDCQAGVAAAEFYFDLPQGESVDRIVVGLTEARICNEVTPAFDVHFLFVGRPQSVGVTVARNTQNRLVACTY